MLHQGLEVPLLLDISQLSVEIGTERGGKTISKAPKRYDGEGVWAWVW